MEAQAFDSVLHGLRLRRRAPKQFKPRARYAGCGADFEVERLGGDPDRVPSADEDTRPCIPGRKSQIDLIRCDKRRYKRRNRIEVMFGRPKNRRHLAARDNRCRCVFLVAIVLAVAALFWL